MAKKVIALSGGIGSGKSTAGRFFANNGFCVIDCDEISAKVATFEEVKSQIADVFGKKYVVDGVLDRRALGAEVFADAKKTQMLNEIFHPTILRELRKRIDQATGLVFVEIPLMEKSVIDWFDSIWLFVAPKEEVIKRVSMRDQRTTQQVEEILDRQKQYFDLKNVVVVSNDGTMEELEQKLMDLLKTVNF